MFTSRLSRQQQVAESNRGLTPASQHRDYVTASRPTAEQQRQRRMGNTAACALVKSAENIPVNKNSPSQINSCCQKTLLYPELCPCTTYRISSFSCHSVLIMLLNQSRFLSSACFWHVREGTVNTSKPRLRVLIFHTAN